jgi:hypothetical protein
MRGNPGGHLYAVGNDLSELSADPLLFINSDCLFVDEKVALPAELSDNFEDNSFITSNTMPLAPVTHAHALSGGGVREQDNRPQPPWLVNETAATANSRGMLLNSNMVANTNMSTTAAHSFQLQMPAIFSPSGSSNGGNSASSSLTLPAVPAAACVVAEESDSSNE